MAKNQARGGPSAAANTEAGQRLLASSLDLRAELHQQFAAAQSEYTSPWRDGGAQLFTAKEASIEEIFLREKGNVKPKDLLVLWMDDEIAEAFETRRAAAITTPWKLQAPDGTKSLRDEDKFIEKELTKVLRHMAAGIWSAVPQGRSFINPVYKNYDEGDDAGRVGWAQVIELPFEKFTVNKDGITVEAAATGTEPKPVDPLQIFTTVRNQTARSMNGEMLLAKLYVAWSYRCHSWDYWLMALDRVGTPFLVGKIKNPDLIVDKSSKTTLLQKATQILDRVRRGSAIVVGAEDDVKSIDVSNVGPQFDLIEKATTKRMRLLILGQMGTTENGAGLGNGGNKVHDTVRMDKRDEDVALIQATVQQCVNALWEMNEFAGAPPAFIMADKKKLEQDRAVRDKDLSDVLERAGLRFNQSYFEEEYGISGDYLEKIPVPKPTGNVAAGSIAELFGARAAKPTTVQLGDQLTELAINDSPPTVPVEKLQQVIRAATSQEDLEAKLVALFTPEELSQFAQFALNARLAATFTGVVQGAARAS